MTAQTVLLRDDRVRRAVVASTVTILAATPALYGFDRLYGGYAASENASNSFAAVMIACVLAAMPVFGLVSAAGRRTGLSEAPLFGLAAAGLTVAGCGYAATSLPAWPLVVLVIGAVVLVLVVRYGSRARSVERFEPFGSLTQVKPSIVAATLGVSGSFAFIAGCLAPSDQVGTMNDVGLILLVLIMPGFTALLALASKLQGTTMCVVYPMAASGVIPLFLFVPYGLGADLPWYWLPFVPAAVTLVVGSAMFLGRVVGVAPSPR